MFEDHDRMSDWEVPIWKNFLQATPPYGEISAESSVRQTRTWPRTVFTPFLAVVTKDTKMKLDSPLKVMLEQHWKAVIRVGTMKSGMADQVWREKGRNQPLWDKVKILDRKNTGYVTAVVGAVTSEATMSAVKCDK